MKARIAYTVTLQDGPAVENMSGTEETVEAHAWRIDASGALIFSDQAEDGSWKDVNAYAPGVWADVMGATPA